MHADIRQMMHVILPEDDVVRVTWSTFSTDINPTKRARDALGRHICSKTQGSPRTEVTGSQNYPEKRLGQIPPSFHQLSIVQLEQMIPNVHQPLRSAHSVVMGLYNFLF